MSFWQQESSCVILCNAVPRFWRVTITSGICLALFAGWGIFFYYPLLQQKTAQICSLGELQKQQEMFGKKLEQAPSVQQRHDFLSQQLDAFGNHKGISSNDLLDLLVTQFKKHDLVCKLLRPSGSKKTCLFDKQYIYFEIKGSFKQVKNFLYDFGDCGLMVKYKKIALVRWKKNMIKGQILLRVACAQPRAYILSQFKDKVTF